VSLSPGGPDLASLSTLDDPVRRRLYDVVTRQPDPVGRDEAAAAAGVGRALAVYHLDKLVESGLLAATYQRPAGRTGPGAGRPAKLYTRADREFTVTVPPRSYELAARLLVQAVEADTSGQSRAALGQAARRLGAELGRGCQAEEADRGAEPGRGCQAEEADRGGARDDGHGDDVEGALTRQGYEPCRGGDGVIRLRNCPFHQLAEQHREVVCGMNLTLIEGLVEGLGVDDWHPVLDPRPGYCCVALGGERP
jgi:predicted ArsR family transcriptional regulator